MKVVGKIILVGFLGCIWAQMVWAGDLHDKIDEVVKKGRDIFFSHYVRGSLKTLKTGKMIESQLYDLAHFLIFHPQLGFTKDDKLVQDVAKYFLDTRESDGTWKWHNEGCLLPKVLAGLYLSGQSKESKFFQKNIERILHQKDKEYQGRGWGECQSAAVIQSWGPNIKYDVCSTGQVNLEKTMKHLFLFETIGDRKPVLSLFPKYSLLSHWGIAPKKDMFHIEDISWVVFTYFMKNKQERKVYEDIFKAGVVEIKRAFRHFDDPDHYATELRDNTFIVCDGLHAYALFNPKYDKLMDKITHFILHSQKPNGKWDTINVSEFEAGIQGDIDGSATINCILALEKIKTLVPDDAEFRKHDEEGAGKGGISPILYLFFATIIILALGSGFLAYRAFKK